MKLLILLASFHGFMPAQEPTDSTNTATPSSYTTDSGRVVGEQQSSPTHRYLSPEYNNTTPGLMVSFDNDIILGAYYNSFKNVSFVAGWSPVIWQPRYGWQTRLVLGAATGYDNGDLDSTCKDAQGNCKVVYSEFTGHRFTPLVGVSQAIPLSDNFNLEVTVTAPGVISGGFGYNF